MTKKSEVQFQNLIDKNKRKNEKKMNNFQSKKTENLNEIKRKLG